MNDPRSVELEVLARLQTAISDSLGRLFDACPSRCYVVNDELAQAMTGSDKLIFCYRAIAKMIENGTPKRFDSQEAELLDQLQLSHKLIADRNGLKLVRNDVDDIGYIPNGDAS